MLAELFGSSLRAKVIGWFFSHSDERFFVRQLTSLLGVDSTNLSRELARLARLGILTFEEEGRQKYYRVNNTSPVYPELKSLAVKTAGVGDVLREALAPLAERLRAAFIFGSFARGDEDARSDVDVMLIGSVTFAEAVGALRPAQERLARELNPTVYPIDEFSAKLADGHHFLTSVVAEPKIFLIGDEDDLTGLAAQ